MDTQKKISMAVIKRLPRYYRYLSDLLANDITRISSRELSNRMNITASQIRQDLNCFGGFGQQGYGYNVSYLYKEIGRILGLETSFKTVIVGAGRLGRALAHYPYFTRTGFELKGLFDIKPEVIGTNVKGLEVMHFNELGKFVKENDIDIAMLTVPTEGVRQVAKDIALTGVKGIWNFSPSDLELSSDVVIENVHLIDSLMVLGYNLDKKYQEDKIKR